MTLNPSPSPDRTPDGSDDSGTSLSRLAGVGIQFGAVISLFALAGYWLDDRIGSSPWLLLLGVLLGFAGGTVSLVKAVTRLKKNADGGSSPST